ncbi:putative bifunctional diguanylate cyclase/phosphodiesterase [Oxalobacteraceae bacterium A2-2]
MRVAVPNDITHWRAQILARLLLIVFALGLFTAIPSALLAASEGMWSIAVVDTGALLWVGLLWRARSLRHATRATHFLLVIYVVGVALMLKVGPVSQIYLLAMPVLAALLLGLRPALWSLAAATLTVMLLGYDAHSTLQLEGMPDHAFLRAAIFTINFLFIGAILTLSSSVLLQHLARSLQQLQSSNDELGLTSAALARLNDMVLIARIAEDGGLSIIFVNDAFERRSGYQREEVLGRGLPLLHGPDTDAASLAQLEHALAHGQATRAELLNYTKNGLPYWVETELVPFAGAGGKPTHWVAVERDITERKRSQDDIHRLAFYDVLTGLPNRRLLMDRLEHLMASSQRGATSSAVMFIDLDRFKTINDARGHAVGDALLCRTAERLAALMRKADTVARLGGDEFVVLLAQLAPERAAAAQAARRVAEKLRTALAEPVEIGGQFYPASASIGVTLYPGTSHSAQDLLREADTAMYRAKSEGRDGIAFFESGMQAELERRLSLERDLGMALAAGELSMHYQPQVDRHGRAVGAELLMRWRRADGSWVSPAQFIPVAEESGLIVELGRWALREACAALLTLANAGHQLALSVNVSPTQFRQAGFVAEVRAALADSGAPAGLLVLEVTEGLLINKRDDTIARMHELAALGLRFSIDDFGTGYSSLAYLKQMPLYELKIDRGFVIDTPHDASSVALVQTILGMASHLGLRVVAEGVETLEQAEFLLSHDCTCLQGYLYARPMPLPELLSWLEKNRV